MSNLFQAIWREDDGVLSFEWTLLITLLAIGIVAGLAAARDSIISELGDVAELTINLDQSFSFAGLPAFGIGPSVYIDTVPLFDDCDRGGPAGQPASDDNPS